MIFETLLLQIILTQLPVITEVATHPVNDDACEFVEIYNPTREPITLTGYSITDGDALDYIIAWDTTAHGAFPGTGLIFGTDVIPPKGIAVVFELDYPTDSVYSIPEGTIILTTGDGAICNGLTASTDPLTLFDGLGTADSNAVSTYGTPVPSDIWQDRDDDGLDNIPADPGEGRSVERFPYSAPDSETAWFFSQGGASPGTLPGHPPDTVNVSCDSVWTVPEAPDAGETFEIFAIFSCYGTVQPETGELIIFLDSQGNRTAEPHEVLASWSALDLMPGTIDTLSANSYLEQGWYLPAGVSTVIEDGFHHDDYSCTPVCIAGGIDPVIIEVMCNPSVEDCDEFIEIFYPGPGIYPLLGSSFTDGDALDDICAWTEVALYDPDAVYIPYLPADRIAVILDPDYINGSQPYNLPESTFVVTIENTSLGNGLTGTDPITLYDVTGTTQVSVVSTYGTPLQDDDPLGCDDDELDGIPFDPGDNFSVERIITYLPDIEYAWITSPEGGTPGSVCGFQPVTDFSVDTLFITESRQHFNSQDITITAVITNNSTLPAGDAEITLFSDMNLDSIAQPSEILQVYHTDSMLPGTKDTVSVSTTVENGGYLFGAILYHPDDENPANDIRLTGFYSGSMNLVITEVMSNPANDDYGEFIEIYNPGPGILNISGCSFTDGDAVDIIIPWDEDEHGEIMDPDVVYNTFLPENRIAIIFDSEYALGVQPYNLPESTLVVTTQNTTLGNGLTGTDPITLYDASGTTQASVVSTYGTPLQNDDPLECDDDGLDGIPYDPGDNFSVERIFTYLPDIEYAWITSPEGGTPGGLCACSIATDLAVDTIIVSEPSSRLASTNVSITAVISNEGTLPTSNAEITIFSDVNSDSIAQPAEILQILYTDSLIPSTKDTVSIDIAIQNGGYLFGATVFHPDDENPANDIELTTFYAGTMNLVITEVVCNPSDEDCDEFFEIFNAGPGILDITGCSFTDGDAVDEIIVWDETELGIIQDPDVLFSPLLPESTFAVILDSEYAVGSQPWNFAPGTIILTTKNTTIGDGLTRNDPLTLYDPKGTARENITSTYGTPFDAEDPLERDDDGLDEIPFDPGEDNSVQRIVLAGPDAVNNWGVSDEGPTPGAPPPMIIQGIDAAVLSLICDPPMGSAETSVFLLADITNAGTDSIPSGQLTVYFYSDINENSNPDEDELIDTYICGPLIPHDTLQADCRWTASANEMLLFVVAECAEDTFAFDDTTTCLWNSPGSIRLNEIMYSPNPGEPEWVEIVNTATEPVLLTAWTFSDSKTTVQFCADSIYISAEEYVLIVSDSTEFKECWPGVDCRMFQPPEWPTLNNTTQQGETWADELFLCDSTGLIIDYVPYDNDWGGGRGISLEKLEILLPGVTGDNWVSCDSTGTPGEPNSCTYSSGTPDGELLEFSPNPFSPDNDGRDDILTISMNPGSGLYELTLTIFNVQGKPVRQLLDNIESESCIVQWDGRTDDRNRLPVGRYIIYLSAKEVNGHNFFETCAVVILARPL